jgi:hypothetical protein
MEIYISDYKDKMSERVCRFVVSDVNRIAC